MEEIWKDIEGYKGLYQVSNLGRVKSIARLEYNKNGRPLPIKERFLRPRSNGVGYVMVTLCKNKVQERRLIHRLVAFAFLDNPNGKKMVNHINGMPLDNTLTNLEWVTMRENVSHGLLKNGSRKKSSIYPGVHFNKVNTHKVWKAMIYNNGKHIYVGNFYTEEDAYKAYLDKLITLGIDNKYSKLVSKDG